MRCTSAGGGLTHLRLIYKIPGKGIMVDVPGAADEVPEEGRGGVESKGEGRSCEGIRCEVKSTFSLTFTFSQKA